MNIVVAVLGAIAYGWMEQHLFSQGAWSDGERFLGFFSWPYHFPAMFMLLFAVSWPKWEFFPVIVAIQDLSYVTFGKGSIHEDDWISEMLGYFNLNGNIIPYAYLLSILITILLIYLKRRHKWTF